MFWWYGRPAMRLISCITGIHSSFGWLTHNVGEFYAPSSGHRIHGDGIYFGNDRAVASQTHSSSWLKRSPSAPAGPHDMFQKVHPICRLMKGRRLQSPLQTRAVNTWHTKDVGPGLRCEAQTLQRSPFLRWAHCELWRAFTAVMGFSPDWCEAVTASRHVKLDDFHPSEEALTSRPRYSSIVSQSRSLRCSVFGLWWEAKWKLNDTVHCFHLNFPFQVFGFLAFMMAVNQTPGLNLNMERYLMWEQLHWWAGRCVCRATSSELNLYHFYHSAF